ncbi:MAG: hypothetical protein PUB42_01830 [Firmicutes bacterium]|nr:hypothetical protein [Bacillota bacterium]
MKNIGRIVFWVMILTYFAGIASGGISQVKSAKQEEMYSYLEGAVADYRTTVSKSVQTACIDNAKLIPFLAAAALFKQGAAIAGTVLFIKGYAAGFSITAVLRLYGIRGVVLCGGNLVSMMILVPVIAYYESLALKIVIKRKEDRWIFAKQYLFILLFLCAALFVDGAVRGLLSALFMSFFPNILTPV